jgi:hypothetical protein
MELRSRTLGLVGLAVAMIAAAVLLTWLLHSSPYVMDEWGLMLRAQNDSATGILEAWNGHLLALGLLLAHVSILLDGAGNAPLVVLDIAGVLSCSALVYVFARRRIGPILALAPAMVPLFFSGTSTFYGTGIQFTPLLGINGIYSLDFGLAGLLLLERERRWDDVLACLMLGLSLASFSYGLPFAFGMAVAIALSPGRWRRAYVVAIPLVLYGLWRIWASHHGGAEAGTITAEHVALAPFYISDSLSASGAGLVGLSQIVGAGPAVEFVRHPAYATFSLTLFLGGVGVALIACVVRALGRRGLTRRSLWPPLATLIAMWGAQALVMDPVSRMPGDPRYLFAGAVMIAVVGSELARGVRLSRLGVVMVLAIAALGGLANLPHFHEGKQVDDRQLAISKAAGAMIELAGPHADPEFVTARDLPEVSNTMWISAANFQSFADGTGLLAWMPIRTLRSASPEIRGDADQVLARVLNLRLAPAKQDIGGRCARISPGSEIALTPGAFVLRSSQSDRLGFRRFAPSAAVSLGALPPRVARSLTIPPDRLSNPPWRLSNEGSAVLALCKTPARTRSRG